MIPTTDTGIRQTTVFQHGPDHPAHRYRIPSAVVTHRGMILAFCEARDCIKGRGGDHSCNTIVLRRSADNGRTWEPLQVVAEDGINSLNNPTAVVVRETGRVLLMYQRYPCGFHTGPIPDQNLLGVEPGYEGDRICRTFLRTSDDDGSSWSNPRDITRSVKRPTGTTTTLCGPGVGIQLRRGPRKGRLVIPFYQCPSTPYRAYTVLSDDLGETWSYGELAENLTEGGPNENQVVELADGCILMNSRRSGPGAKCRKVALSRDGGETWSGITDEPALISSGCQGSILRYTDPLDGHRSRILFCNPASETTRENGTVRMSYDEGRTWPVRKALPNSGLFAYSCLTVLPDMTVGCLYETTPSNVDPITVRFARFTLEWLTDGRDVLK